MIALFFKKTFQDLTNNRFLHSITVVTISLSVLIVSSFALFFTNAGLLLDAWKKGIRVLVYLQADTDEAARLDLNFHLKNLEGVVETRFIARETALAALKTELKDQDAVFENLKENPLPDTYDVRIRPEMSEMQNIARLAQAIAGLPHVADVEYGQHWIGRFSNVVQIFRFAGYAMGGLFVLATLFIVANTIRLVVYSRQDEVDIMRLIGATERFIRAPFYIESVILGAGGGVIGVLILWGAYRLVLTRFETGLADGFRIGFLPPAAVAAIIAGSMLVGWIGCYLSLKQFAKT